MPHKTIIGIDEAGRGPLAGPLVIAAVMGVRPRALKGIKDSKKLSPKAREAWFRVIKKDGVCSFVLVSAAEIDRDGLSIAIQKAIARLVNNILKKSQTARCKILLDGSLFAPKKYAQKTIIRGDERVPIIAAASIIAKVTRDRKMHRLHRNYPLYGFDQHKGYGTRAHFAAIREHGLSAIHRKSFCTRVV